MKKVFLLSIFLVNLLPMITGNKLFIGMQIANAQSMGGEVTYYPCKEWNTQKNDYDWHFSTTPCDNLLQEACVTVCPFCNSSMSCDSYTYHHCSQMDSHQENNSNNPGYPSYPPYTTYPSGGGGSGGSSSPSSGSSSTKPDDGKKHQQYYGDYDENYYKSFGHNISLNKFNTDLQKSPETIIQNPSTCSAAAIEKCLAELHPDIFNKIANDLYSKGQSDIAGLHEPECLSEYRYDYIESHTQYHDNMVDLLMQTALINTMNYIYNYNPITDNGNLSNCGWETPAQVQNMLISLFGKENVTYENIPSWDDMRNIDYGANFVIVLCRFNTTDDNLNGTNLHYAQIKGVNGDNINYWSWASPHNSNINETSHLISLFIVKRF